MKPVILGIGELLWDDLPGGRRPGGAPANFAFHARQLGADGRVVSRVGDDADGRELLSAVSSLGLPTDTIGVDQTSPTGVVTVSVDAAGSPTYTIREGVAWDHIAADGGSRRSASSADAVCFGSLAQRSAISRAAIRELVALTPASALRVFDVNLRQSYYSREVIEESLRLANALKLNEDEIEVFADMFSLPAGDEARLRELSRRYALRLAILTRGGDGSVMLRGDEISEVPAAASEVIDTIGAGDSFTAAAVVGVLRGWPLADVHARAAAVAGYVCSRRGATPELPTWLTEPFAA